MPREFADETEALDFLHSALSIADKQDQAVDDVRMPGTEPAAGGSMPEPSVPIGRPQEPEMTPTRRIMEGSMERGQTGLGAPMGRDQVPAGLRGPPPAHDQELGDLQKYAANRRKSALLGMAGSNFADALTTPSARTSNGFWDKYGAEGDQAVSDLKARRASDAARDTSAKAAADDAEDSDPASARSEFARSLIGRFAPSVDVTGKSAKDIKAFAPWITAAISKTPKAPSPPPIANTDPLKEEKTQAEIDRIKADTERLKRPPPVHAPKADHSAEKAKAATGKAVTDLRKEFDQLPEVKSFKEVDVALTKVKNAAANPSPAGDLSLIYAYNKLLDPGSAVKEAEFRNAALAGSFGDKIQAQVSKVVSGQMLTPEQRKDFVAQSQNLYASHRSKYDAAAKRYGGLATKSGGASEDVVFAPDGEQAAPPAGKGGLSPEKKARLEELRAKKAAGTLR